MTRPELVDTMVHGTVISLDDELGIIDDGSVAIAGDTIVAVGPRANVEAAYTARNAIEVPEGIVLPGLIDAHTHTGQALVRGLIANELPMIFRLYVPASRSLSLAEYALSAKLVAAQLLRSGVTTICEGAVGHGAEAEEVALAAFAEAGIRVVFARGGGDQDFHHAELYSQVEDRSWMRHRDGEAQKDLDRTRALLQRFPTDGSGLTNIAVCPSGVIDFSAEYFAGAAALAEEFDARLHVHLARDREEVELCLACFGKRPIERLAEMGFVSDRLLAVHCMLASEVEIELLRRGGASLAHSPIECLNIFNAVPPVQRFRAAGIKVGLGCDNAANDMWETMRAVWLMQGTARGLPSYDAAHITENDVLPMATRESAEALGISRHVGRIAPGMKADLQILDGSGPHMFPRQNLAAELMRYGTRAEVDTVLVNGRVVLQGGKHTTIDVAELRHQSIGAAARIRELIEDRRYQPMTTDWRMPVCRCGQLH